MTMDWPMSDAEPVDLANAENTPDSDEERSTTAAYTELVSTFQNMFSKEWGSESGNQQHRFATSQTDDSMDDDMDSGDCEYMSDSGGEGMSDGNNEVKTFEQLTAMHEHAVQLLDVKMRKVPFQMMAFMKKPTIRDIYSNSGNTLSRDVPPDLELPFFLERYADIAGANFTAMHDNQHMDVSRAIWYWRVDKRRSFISAYDEIRYNLILMVLLITRYDGLQDMSEYGLPDGAIDFARAFKKAWEEAKNRTYDYTYREQFLVHWKESRLDLMRFGKGQRRVMRKTVKELKEMMPFALVPEDGEFAGWGTNLSADDMDKFGPLFALRWYLFQHEAAQEEEKVTSARVANTAPTAAEMDLTRVPFTIPLVEGLLASLDAPPLSCSPQLGGMSPVRPWMDPSKAIGIMQNQVISLVPVLRDTNMFGG